MADRCPEDYDYNGFIEVFNTVINKIKGHKDKQTCLKWFDRIQQYEASTVREKRKRNTFIKLLTQIMKQGYLTQLLKLPAAKQLTPQEIIQLRDEMERVGYEQYNANQTVLNKLTESMTPDFKCHWSEDGNTYVAIQPLEGEGALVYMATCDPNIPGWIQPQAQ